MSQPKRTIRLPEELYLRLLLMARASGLPVEEIVEVAFRYFASLSLEEKVRLMYESHAQPGPSSGMTEGPYGRRPPYFGDSPPGTVLPSRSWWAKVKHCARVALSWLGRS